MLLLVILKDMLKFQISDLNDYIKEANRTLENKQNELEKELDDTLSKIIDEDEKQQVIDWYLDDNLKYFNNFPEIQNDALFLVIYSFFELSMSRICRMVIRDARVLGTTITPPKDSYIQQSKKFLDDANLKLKAKDNVWKKIDKLRDYRNFIAHNGSDFHNIHDGSGETRKRATINYINRYFGKPIKESQYGKCNIEKVKLLFDFLNLVETYLNFAIDQALKKYKRPYSR